MLEWLNDSERLLVGSGPGCRGRYVGLCRFQPRLLNQEPPVQIGQKILQLFQIAAVFERFFIERNRCLGLRRRVPQAFRCPQKLAE